MTPTYTPIGKNTLLPKEYFFSLMHQKLNFLTLVLVIKLTDDSGFHHGTKAKNHVKTSVNSDFFIMVQILSRLMAIPFITV